MARYCNIVVLTGAGISAESGVATFRDKDGIWSKYNIEDVATPQAFRRNPELVHDFYNARRKGHAGIKPNAAHLALARLEREHAGRVTVVTQNIDALHEAAGSANLIHMHGELLKAFCLHCDARQLWTGDLSLEVVCPSCGKRAGMRPDELLDECDLFLSIGTSGNVYPAAGFVADAVRAGAHTVELNLEPSEGVSMFREVIHGRATEVVPAYVARVLGER